MSKHNLLSQEKLTGQAHTNDLNYFFIHTFMKYVAFPKGQQRSFLQKVKKNGDLTWDKIAKFLGLHRSMIFFYLKETSKMSKESYERLCQLGKIKEETFDLVIINNKKNIIVKPQLDENLAEFVGALAGDGHISAVNGEISISGHQNLDKEYLSQYWFNKLQRLFSLQPKTSRSKISKVMKLYMYSKELQYFLIKEFCLPQGKKKHKLHIPRNIWENKHFLKAYIRGLFDTDGSVYLRRNKDIVVSIISRDVSFLEEVRQALEKLEYFASVSGKNLYIYRKKDVKKFFKEIKPANEKHQKRYLSFVDMRML